MTHSRPSSIAASVKRPRRPRACSTSPTTSRTRPWARCSSPSPNGRVQDHVRSHPERELDQLADAFGARVLRSPRPSTGPAVSSTSTSAASPDVVRRSGRPRERPALPARGSDGAGARSLRADADLRRAGRADREAGSSPRGGRRVEPKSCPDRPSLPSRRRERRPPRRVRGRPRSQASAARARGRHALTARARYAQSIGSYPLDLGAEMMSTLAGSEPLLSTVRIGSGSSLT